MTKKIYLMSLYTKIWQIDSKYKKGINVIIAHVDRCFLETLSIGLIIPLVSIILIVKIILVMSLLTYNEYIWIKKQKLFVNFWYNNFFIAFLVKIIFLIFISYSQNKFTYQFKLN